MKTLITFALSFIFIPFNLIMAQAPNWQWAKNGGGVVSDAEGSSVVVDATGNSYVTGSFQGKNFVLGSYTLINKDSASSDIFMAKYDPSGNVVWAKGLGGDFYDYAESIALDANGNIYITGSFRSASISINTTTLTNSNLGSSDFFIMKYDTSGNLIWAKSTGGNKDDVGYSLTLSTTGELYVTGAFSSPTISFGANILVNASSNSDVFVVKFDALGNVLWAKSAGGTNSDQGNGIITDANGNVYVVGNYLATSINFGGSTTLTNAGYTDLFIVKYDASGNLLWAKSAGGTGDDSGREISIDATGNVYIIGEFKSDYIGFGSTVLTNNNTIPPLFSDAFIVKYNSSGAVVWVKQFGGFNGDYAFNIITDASGNSYVTGTTNVSVLSTSSDLFVAKYDVLGNLLWTKTVVSTDWVQSASVGIDANGNSYITGTFYAPTITFDNSSLINSFFVAKLGSTVGIEENSNSDFIQLYPNPSKGIFFITSEKDISKIEIVNVLGEKVYLTNTIKSQSINQIDLSNRTKGIYFIIGYSENERFLKKIVIQ